MRRTRIGSLIGAGILSAILVPATALGVIGSADPTPGGDAAPAALLATAARTTPAEGSGFGLAVAKRATTSARHRLLLRLAETTDVPVPGTGTAAGATTSPPAGDPVARPILRIRLGCELVRTDAVAATDLAASIAIREPAVACRWSAIDTAKVRAYQLWRAVDVPGGGPRRLLATVPAGQPLRHLDTGVSRGHVYTYVVVAVGRDGSRLGVSAPAKVTIPPAPESLRMACALASVGDRRGVACKWSEAMAPEAAGYVLWRSIDGGAREAIYKAGLDGRRGFFDTDVKPGQTIRYAVVVLDRSGARIGVGGPVTIRIPSPQP